MTFSRLILRSAAHHWRTNTAVVMGVAAAVAVLAGALVVGDSVRGSLRDLALGRLGRTGTVVASAGFFPDRLAAALSDAVRTGTAPLVATTGFVTHEPSGRRAGNVLVYGVDERFWSLHGLDPLDGVFASPALAAELGARDGDVLLTRLQRPSEIPLESLFAQKEDVGRTVRLTVSGVLGRDRLGEFTLRPQQAEVRALFAPLRRIQRDLGVAGQVNTVLIADGPDEAAVDTAFRTALALEDLGVRVSVTGQPPMLSVESTSGVLNDALDAAGRRAGESLALTPLPVFTYLANTMRIRDREIPYSLIAAVDVAAVAPPGDAPPPAGAIVLNAWAARELRAAPGDPLEVEYYLWDAAAGLRIERASFTVLRVVPIAGFAADRRLAPEYPGITGAESLADWEPPFPIDLSRVRPQDEAYWDEYRTTAKAFIPYERGRDLWRTRYGAATSLRFAIPPDRDAAALAASLAEALRGSLSPAAMGVTLTPARRLALEASRGATDFGEYFTYFSFFLVISALLLSVLFFRLGVEQRLRQIGIMRAAGFTIAAIRRLMLAEGAVLAFAGSLLGIAGAIAYAEIIVYGLRTWWSGAVNTTLLEVHVTVGALVAGAVGGIVAALGCVYLSLRAVAKRTPRSLLAAQSLDVAPVADPRRAARNRRIALVLAAIAALLSIAGFTMPAAQAGAFFGAGAALLAAMLLLLAAWLRSRDMRPLKGRGSRAVARLGFRSAAFRPGRSVLSAALIASAAFIIVAVDAFRRDDDGFDSDPRSGTGGFALLAQADVPIVHNLNEPSGRETLLIRAPELERARFTRFRIRPGEDASCLNLYRPENPTIIAPERGFIEQNRFTFSASLAATDDERANPWLLLRRTFEDGAVPVIADATSLQYVLHASIGDTFAVDTGGERPLTLRFVGALRDSVLQGQLIMDEDRFLASFPGQQGFRFFLIEAPGVTTSEQAATLAEIVERELAPFGLDAVSTTERLAAFHRVENTYLSTFQALGGLGLLLGTIGLATVMFRNVLERRRELALLRAVGYNSRHVAEMIVAETAFLLGAGLVGGAGCALIAIAPAWLGRGGGAPGVGLVLLLAAVAAAGLLASLAATRAALSGSVLRSLRAE